MYGYVCAICNGYCDPGELTNGICIECAEKEKSKHIRMDRLSQFLNSPSYQMELNLEVISNG